MPAPEAATRDELLRRIDAGPAAPLDDREFDDLARAVFRHQFHNNAPFRAFCQARDVSPERLRHWTAIPAVPAAAFKVLPLVCGDPGAAAAVFRTSGTTAGRGRRGEHYVPDLAPYHAALRAGFAAHLLPDGARPRMISLVPPPAAMPDSSLSHMVGRVVDEFGGTGSDYHADAGGVDVDGAIAGLRAAEAAAVPTCLLTTSFALVRLIDELAARGLRLRLPGGARLMDTGGFKGRTREIDRAALYREVEDRLGIAAPWCVNEYGMTELGSQFYDTVAGDPAGAAVANRLHRGPGWVRTRATDPETLAVLPDGEPGILCHWDLANLGSVIAVQTEDVGVVEAGGFRVLGRAAGAEPRGCSLAMEDLMAALDRRGGR